MQCVVFEPILHFTQIVQTNNTREREKMHKKAMFFADVFAPFNTNFFLLFFSNSLLLLFLRICEWGFLLLRFFYLFCKNKPVLFFIWKGNNAWCVLCTFCSIQCCACVWLPSIVFQRKRNTQKRSDAFNSNLSYFDNKGNAHKFIQFRRRVFRRILIF